MKTLMSKRCLADGETIEVTYSCSAIITCAMAEKKEDLGDFTIPCIIGTHKFDKALCKLGASINIMPYEIYQCFGLGTPTPTTMRLLERIAQ